MKQQQKARPFDRASVPFTQASVLVLLIFTIACLVSESKARIVTLTTGGAKTNASLSIATNESLTILAGRDSGIASKVIVEKEGLQQQWPLYYFDSTYNQNQPGNLPRAVIAGPATLTLVQDNFDSGLFGFVTVEIVPDNFPPEKTLVLPEGTGANIVLKSSTNLVNWPAPLGIYTNRTGNMFFRVRADRMP